MDRRLLSGLPEDARKALEDLGAAGWSGKKTGGGHIKLTHPLAAAPVFAASTPSCPRSMKNTTAICRRMLRQGVAPIEERSADPAPATIELPIELDAKRRRKDKPRHASRPAILAKSQPTMIEEGNLPMPTQIEAPPAATIAKPVVASAPNPAPAIVPIAETKEPASLSTAEAPKATEVPEAVAKEVPARKVISRAAPKSAANSSGVDRISIDARTLGLALEILQGRLPRIRITADMVGQTMIWRDDRFMLIDMPDIGDIGDTASSAQPASPKKEEESATSGGVSAQEGKRRDQLIHLLQTFSDDWMTVRDLQEMDESGIFGSTPKSQSASIRFSLQALVEGGEAIVQERIGRGTAAHANRYRIAG